MIPQETINSFHLIRIRICSFIDLLIHNLQLLKYYLLMNSAYLLLSIYIYNTSDIGSALDEISLKGRIIAIWILLNALIVFLFGYGIQNLNCKKAFEKIGFKNKVDVYPILIKKTTSNNSVTLTFHSSGIPYDVWEDNILKLENVLNVTISEITTGNSDAIIIIKGYSGKYNWNKPIAWDATYLPADSELIVGQSVGGNLYCDLNTYAHILIGGMTGSGKTILLKQLILQCIVKKYQVYIADFKQGVDYSDTWRNKCTFLTNRNVVLNHLKAITKELDNRLALFSKYNCKDIDSFNQFIDGDIDRIIFACDELAELLDTTRMAKEEKAVVKEIEGNISKIARLGRAVGIHLILATQRPDADVLNGQIKSNMTYRLCGRSNEVLSRIILDSTDAAKLIPNDAKGVFINQDGIRIKGFNIHNDDLEISLNATVN